MNHRPDLNASSTPHDPYAGRTVTNPEMGGALRQHREKTVPKEGDLAPDFTLVTPDGREEVTLSTFCQAAPVVLVFGNYSCGPFKRATTGIKAVHERFGDDFRFLFIYVREAHPLDGWTMEISHIEDPKTLDERQSTASACSRDYGLTFPAVVDTMDDAVASRYNGWPERLYVVGQDQTVIYAGGIGPGGVWPLKGDAIRRNQPPEASLEGFLEKFLQ